MNIKDVPPHTLITGVVAVAWLASFGIRAAVPDFELGTAADALMTTTVGYWFTANHKAGDGDSLLGEVVTKVGMPYIATAHTDKPTKTGTTPPSMPPKPSLPPKSPQSPPASKPKQGGLPWG